MNDHAAGYAGTGTHDPDHRAIENFEDETVGAPWNPRDGRLTPPRWAPVPEWVEEYRPHQWDAALEVCEAFHNGAGLVFVDAPTGCLSGYTMVGVNRAGKGYRCCLAELYAMQRAGRQRSDIPTKVQRADVAPKYGLAVRLGEATVVRSGMKETHVITTRGGRTIRATKDHLFCMDGGTMVPLSQLEVGDALLIDVGKSKKGESKKSWYRVVQGLSNHPQRGEWPYRQPEHRLVVEAEMNNLPLDWYIAILRDKKTNVESLTFLAPSVHVHHKDGDPTNNALENLEIKDAKAHLREHGLEGQWVNVATRIGLDHVETIEPFGTEMTYDIVMADDPHNFIANGFVVHNSGKTLLGDLIARLMAQPAVYLCTTKSLQDQVLTDYPYAKVLKGKANYRTMFKPFPEYTADDCNGTDVQRNDCTYCDPMQDCAYRVAKAEAIRSQLAVINMAYWLREANYVRQPAFSLPPDPNLETTTGRRRKEGGLFIVDECDTLENQLLGFVEFSVSKQRARELRVTPPRKGVHKATQRKWILEELVPALDAATKGYSHSPRMEDQRRARRMKAMHDNALFVADQIEDENWIRDYERESTVPYSMKPVRVDGYGPKYVWRHGGRFVLMSATIISPEEMVQTLGYDGEYAVVRVPMTFDPAQRPIIVAGVANMTYKTEVDELPKLVKAIDHLLREHDDVRVLIHTVSYTRAKTLMKELRHKHDRRFFTYSRADERDDTLAAFRSTENSVLLAPSFERGIDLAHDDCRVQIVVKMPYLNTSDPRVNARMRGPGGDGWMAVQTIRSLVQMTGRAVRHDDDWCATYILDQQFMSKVWKHNKDLLPEWWREAVDTQFRVRDLFK